MQNLILTLKHLVQEAAAAPDSRSRVEGIVTRVKTAMDVAVCSFYLVDENGVLTLVATDGLNPESVGRIRLRIGEGLVGWIAKTQHPLNVKSASEDPHFLFFSRLRRRDLRGLSRGARGSCRRTGRCVGCRTEGAPQIQRGRGILPRYGGGPPRLDRSCGVPAGTRAGGKRPVPFSIDPPDQGGCRGTRCGYRPSGSPARYPGLDGGRRRKGRRCRGRDRPISKSRDRHPRRSLRKSAKSRRRRLRRCSRNLHLLSVTSPGVRFFRSRGKRKSNPGGRRARPCAGP